MIPSNLNPSPSPDHANVPSPGLVILSPVRNAGSRHGLYGIRKCHEYGNRSNISVSKYNIFSRGRIPNSCMGLLHRGQNRVVAASRPQRTSCSVMNTAIHCGSSIFDHPSQGSV